VHRVNIARKLSEVQLRGVLRDPSIHPHSVRLAASNRRVLSGEHSIDRNLRILSFYRIVNGSIPREVATAQEAKSLESSSDARSLNEPAGWTASRAFLLLYF